MTDGNTQAIAQYLDERDEWDALQEVTAELELAEARIEELEATLQHERLAKWKVLESPLKTRALEAEAKLSKSEALLEKALRALAYYGGYSDANGGVCAYDGGCLARTTLAELSSVSCANLKGQTE